MARYQVHEDYRRLNVVVPFYPAVLPFLQRITRFKFTMQTVPDAISHQKRFIQTDEHHIPIEIFSPIDIEKDAPCLLFLHGGAFALPGTDHHKKLIFDYALGCACKVVYVDYRLAPQFPYPYGLEDCYSAYIWILDHAEELGIDTARIGICGDSAGGALAAALLLMLRDRSLHMPLFHVLIYPVLDATQSTASIKKYVDTPVWNARLNERMWAIYLNGTESAGESYASPLHAESCADLPSGYIEVNEFDCLSDEAVAYFHRLTEQGIEMELVQTKGTIHGFELNYGSSYTQEIIKKRIAYMRTQFYR